MTISAYQTLYESSVAFGMRKALQDGVAIGRREGSGGGLSDSCDTRETGGEAMSQNCLSVSCRRVC